MRAQIVHIAEWKGRGMAESNVMPMPERRADRNAWLTPQFIVTIISLIVGISGGLLGTYVLAEARAAKTEVILQSLNDKMTRVEASVQTVSYSVAALQAAQQQDRREIDDIKRKQEAQDAWTQVINSKLATIQARQEAEKGR